MKGGGRSSPRAREANGGAAEQEAGRAYERVRTAFTLSLCCLPRVNIVTPPLVHRDGQTTELNSRY